jgi:hypothetical protein
MLTGNGNIITTTGNQAPCVRGDVNTMISPPINAAKNKKKQNVFDLLLKILSLINVVILFMLPNKISFVIEVSAIDFYLF